MGGRFCGRVRVPGCDGADIRICLRRKTRHHRLGLCGVVSRVGSVSASDRRASHPARVSSSQMHINIGRYGKSRSSTGCDKSHLRSTLASAGIGASTQRYMGWSAHSRLLMLSRSPFAKLHRLVEAYHNLMHSQPFTRERVGNESHSKVNPAEMECTYPWPSSGSMSATAVTA